jgi:hypothetical protein
MNALCRLEQGGYSFELNAADNITFHYDPHDGGPPMAERPEANRCDAQLTRRCT